MDGQVSKVGKLALKAEYLIFMKTKKFGIVNRAKTKKM